MLLAAAGKKFEDNRIEFADWPKLKPSKYDMGGWITCDFLRPFQHYSRLSLSRSLRDPLKHFEISDRFSELMNIQFAHSNFSNEYLIRLL